MINNSVIKLEDGNDYVVVDKIDLENKSYVFLTNVKDMEDFCVRKEIEENEEVFLVGLETESEYEEAMKLFVEKNNKNA